MKVFWLAACMAVLSGAAMAQDPAAPQAGRGAGRGGPPVTVWAPKPDKSPYIAPNRPQVKLADLVSKHARQQDWAETVVRDAAGLTGRYIQRAPAPAARATPRAATIRTSGRPVTPNRLACLVPAAWPGASGAGAISAARAGEANRAAERASALNFPAFMSIVPTN